LHVVAAPDKFRGTASALEVATAVERAVAEYGGTTAVLPMADGGEGTLEALGGPNQTSLVTGPLGGLIEAPWQLTGTTAIIEMAKASGLITIGGPEFNEVLNATSAGTGELILSAVEHGATRIIVGLGGSASTDGGLGAIEAMGSPARYRGIEILVACDVNTRFVDSAKIFSPQKGATKAEVEMLERRLKRLVQIYEEKFGIDVSSLNHGGAAGGLAGGLAALGARLVDGFDLVADELRLDEFIEKTDLVITGEGRIDQSSFDGKVVGGVFAYASAMRKPILAIAGQVEIEVKGRIQNISLTEEFGEHLSQTETANCVEQSVVRFLEDFNSDNKIF
tara:strand:+ start:2641 stop:3648 length:1008 start_codon:yes stop_codon:yes gene_type:complete